jgi:hypothetical protein
MPWIVLIRKPYHERRGKPSPIRDACRLRISRWGVLISNDGGEPFNGGNNGPPGGSPPKVGGSGLLGGGGSGLLGGGNSAHLKDQKPKPYVARLIRPWIGST